MSKEEQQLCYEIIRDGDIIRLEKFMCDNVRTVCYLVVYYGRFYSITTRDGEFIYFFHHMTTDGLESDVEYCKQANIELYYIKRG